MKQNKQFFRRLLAVAFWLAVWQAAAMAIGASWPRKFLERVVGELLGSNMQDISTAVADAARIADVAPRQCAMSTSPAAIAAV